jgi:hypothetical protein
MMTPVFLRTEGRTRSLNEASGLYCRPRGCTRKWDLEMAASQVWMAGNKWEVEP